MISDKKYKILIISLIVLIIISIIISIAIIINMTIEPEPIYWDVVPIFNANIRGELLNA